MTDRRPVAPPLLGTPRNLVPDIRASLEAKLERLLSQPLLAGVVGASDPGSGGDEREGRSTETFAALLRAARHVVPATNDPWREDPTDGTCSVRIWLDYEDVWRGHEKEILVTVKSTIENAVTFLTDAQKELLERSPREFMALSPPPESAELLSFDTENVGGAVRIVGLKLAAAPECRAHVRHVAIIPNLVQIERQLDALHQVEMATDVGPLAPLRALVGACDPSVLPAAGSESATIDPDGADATERLDEFQRECATRATVTPHFAVIEGPPGSGKTTVITTILRRALARGERALVVSPTHVAVDNVVEKLVALEDGIPDRLGTCTLPVRYAAKFGKLSPRALEYWVGAKKQRRSATIARRVQARLSETVPFAHTLFELEDPDSTGQEPISSTIASLESVICGTPIGILSFDPVKDAAPGGFDLLVVDEVSKMTISEFLAVAVKARRWVVVGDPQQLPPYNDIVENGCTLNDVVTPPVELACSVGAVLERVKPHLRSQERLVVVASDPPRATAAIHAHLDEVGLGGVLSVGCFGSEAASDIAVCTPDDVDDASDSLSPPENHGTDGGAARFVRILVERGLRVDRPPVASGRRLVELRERAPATIFENAFNVYHAQPWAIRSEQRLRSLAFRNGLEKYMPSATVLAAENDSTSDGRTGTDLHCAVTESVATRFAVNTVSVYDWLTGVPEGFDVSPLRELAGLSSPALREAVGPFVGSLKRQYRMHTSLSRTPRALFYFDEALLDGRPDEKPGCRVALVQVDGNGEKGESNAQEVDTILALLGKLSLDAAAHTVQPKIMIITPYREQEGCLRDAIATSRDRNELANLDIEACTLDRCQGREAEYVLISLVRSSAGPFLDMPKRWNVAVTRAKQGLFLVGNVEAYEREANRARREVDGRGRAANGTRARRVGRNEKRPQMSVLARLVEAYSQQARGRPPSREHGVTPRRQEDA